MFLSLRSFRQAQLFASSNTFSQGIKGYRNPYNSALIFRNAHASFSISVIQRTEGRAVPAPEHHAQTLPNPSEGRSSRSCTDQGLVRLLNEQTSRRKLSVDGEALDYRKAKFEHLDSGDGKKKSGSVDGEAQDIIDAYVTLRKQGGFLLKRLHPLALVHVAWKARQENLESIVISVVDDVLSLHEGNLAIKADIGRSLNDGYSWDYFLAIAHLLDLVSDYGRKRHERALALTKAFLFGKADGLETLPNLSTHALVGISRAIVAQRADWTPENIPLLKAFVEYLDHVIIPSALEAHPSQEDAMDGSLMWSFFRLSADLAHRGCEEIAYLLFRFLVMKEYIPPTAVQEADQATNDLRTTILSALVRSCIEYGWLDGASRLLQTADLSNPKLGGQLSRLLYRIVYAAVQTRTLEKIELSSKLIIAMFTQNNAIRLSDGLVRQFYMVASSVGAGEAAVKTYTILRSAPIRARHVFPAPDGPALVWFLNNIYSTGLMEVGKLLAQHLVESPDTLSIYLRGSVIALCAAMGHAEETKKLWERYSEGQDKDTVVGHARAMVNVVSLFYKRSELAKKKMRTSTEHSLDLLKRATTDDLLKKMQSSDLSSQQDPSTNVNNQISQKRPSRVHMSVLQAEYKTGPSEGEHMRFLPSDPLLDSTDASIASRDLEAQATEAQKPPHDDSNTFLISSQSDALDTTSDLYSKSAEDTCAPSADLASHSAPVGAETASSTADGSAIGEDVNLAFAHHVFESFRWAKEPLNASSHHDLTTLARAAAILGDIEMCTRTLRLIIERREVPDLFDLNVIVASMAHWKPRQAAFMVIKMIKSGIKPNGFTFASILHGALGRNDMELALKIFRHARVNRLSQLMPEMCIALVHASLNAAAPHSASQDKDDAPEAEAQLSKEMRSKIEYLRQAYDLLTSDVCPAYIHTMHLGRRCVEGALGLNDPTLAFEFWKLMLKARADGLSKRQAGLEWALRQRVADKIRKECQRGRLERNRGREMVAELGELW